MGLDMYLEGEMYHWTDWKNPENNPTVDGFELKTQRLRIGYWRKHPDLHGYIIQVFAKGVDDCKDVELSKDNLLDIIKAIKNKSLPNTKGFFFGESSPEDDEPTIEILEKAIGWVEKEVKGIAKTLYYRASW